MMPKKHEFKGKRKQINLYVHDDFEEWLDKNREEKSRAAFLEDLALQFDAVVDERARAVEEKYEAQSKRLLKPFQDSFGRVERIEQWLFAKAYEKCSKCGRYRIPHRDFMHLPETDVVYVLKNFVCLCS